MVRNNYIVNVTNACEGKEFLKIERPFRWLWQAVHIYDASDNYLGAVKLRCTFCSRKLSVYDAHNNEIYNIYSDFCECWTLHIRVGEENVGEIRKKWSGMGKELFTVCLFALCGNIGRMPIILESSSQQPQHQHKRPSCWAPCSWLISYISKKKNKMVDQHWKCFKCLMSKKYLSHVNQ